MQGESQTALLKKIGACQACAHEFDYAPQILPLPHPSGRAVAR